MKLHTYCSMIPPMSKTEYARLKDSIQTKGLLVPIVLLGAEILDGRHRYQACKELGIKPDTVRYKSDDPFGYAVSLNATRRHLNQSQRALLAANMADMKQGTRTDTQPSANLQEVSRQRAAEVLNVSERLVNTAKSVQKSSPSVVEAVKSGAITLNAAQRVVENIEPEILIKASSAQIESMAKTVGERVEVRIAKITQLAKQLRSEYDSLSRYEQSDVVITAFYDVDFELGLIAQIKSNKTKVA